MRWLKNASASFLWLLVLTRDAFESSFISILQKSQSRTFFLQVFLRFNRGLHISYKISGQVVH